MDLLTTTIDLDAIAHNTRVLKKLAGTAQLMCVVKADGYNHGAVETAQVMARNGADQFGVATLPEAQQLLDGGIDKPILAWMWRPEQTLIEGIELGIPSPEHARAAINSGLDLRVTPKIDTGLNRSGIDEADWADTFRLLHDAPNIAVTGLFSHLACADEPGDPSVDEQADVFRRAIAVARDCELDVPTNHLSNSPAALTRPDLNFEMIRPGLACYGLSPIPGVDVGLRPAMTWAARVSVVKKITAGEGVSYGHTWRAPSNGYTAVITVGYADGLPRTAQDALSVTIGGARYSQVGRVCMDQIVVWLGAEASVRAGDEALIFGSGEQGEMTADELAEGLGTINYEVICRPSGRTVRKFKGGDVHES